MGDLSVLLDSSILLGPRRGVDEGLDDAYAISVISVGELETGVLGAPSERVRAARLHRLGDVLDEARVLAVDRRVASRYGELRTAIRRAPSNDLWIAATALAHDLTLMTADQSQAKLPLVRTELVS